MLNVSSVLQHQGLSLDSPLRSMQTVRQIIDGSSVPCKVANTYIKELLGQDPAYTDPLKARLVAMGVVEVAVRNRGEIKDIEELLHEQEVRAEKQMTTDTWMYATKESPTATAETKAVAEGSDVQVAVKKDGSIKKGGKTTLCEDLYKTFLRTTSLDPAKPEFNKAFKKILQTQVDMTEAGSTTYTYNMRKKFGIATGK